MADTLTTRQQRSELERVAQVAMNKAREAQRLESRKRDLPITSARTLGTKQFIRDIETARREGHQVSEVTPATEKQAVAPQTEKSGTEIFADMVASGQIGKDAVYDSYDKATGQVSYHIPGKPKTGWQIFDEMLASKELPSNAVYQGYDSATGTLNYYLRPELYLFRASMPDGSTIDIYAKTQTEAKAIAKAKGAYTITVRMIPTDPKNTPELFSKRVFANMQATGDIPKEAVYAGYDKATDTFQYSMPDTRTGQQIFNDMQTKGEIPKDAAFESYTAATGEVTYRLPDTRTTEQVFSSMVAAGDIPKGAILSKFDAETGTMTWRYDSGETALQALKDEGSAHELAVLQGYNPDTGEVTYSEPKTNLTKAQLLAYWDKLTPEQQRIQINGALNKPIYGKYKTWSELTDAEQQQVMWYYCVSYLPFQVNDVQAFKDIWEDQKQQLKAIAIGMIPVYGTIYNWNNMSTAWKAISVATDALFIIPIVKAGTMALKASVASMRGTKIVAEVAAIAKQEAKLSTAMSRKLTATCGNTVGKAYSSMTKAQIAYLKQLAKVDVILTKGKIPAVKVAGNLVVLEQGLRKAATVFAESLYKSNKVSVFDSPDIAAQFRTWSIGSDMVANTKGIIAGLKYSKATVKALTRAVAKAERVLATAKAKYPMDAGRWADLAFDLSRKQSQLYLAIVGDVNTMYKQLLAARSAGKVAEAARVEAKLAKALKSMTIEDIWGKQWSGSRVATIQAKPISPSGIVTPLKGAGIGPGIMASKAVTALSRASVEVGGMPEAMPKVVTVSTPEVIRAATSVGKVQGATMAEIEQALALAVNVATDNLTKGMPMTDIKVSVKQSIQTELRTATQTQLKAMTKVAIKTAQKVAQKVVTKVKLRPTIKDKDGKERPMTDAELAGAAAWKQGFTYIMRYPPYGKDDIQYSSTPFPGVKTLEGIGSAYKTIVRLGGKLPATIKTDMGIMDIDIKTRQGKPVLSFAVEGWHRPRRFTPRRPIARRRKSELQLSIAR